MSEAQWVIVNYLMFALVVSALSSLIVLAFVWGWWMFRLYFPKRKQDNKP